MKRILVLILVVIMLVAVGCSPSTGGNEQPSETKPSAPATNNNESSAPDPNANKSLVVWHQKWFSAVANDAFVERTEQFAAEKGVEVNLQMLDGSQLPILFNAGLEAGATPDVSVTADWVTLHLFPDPPFMDLTQFIDEIQEKSGRTFIKAHYDNTFIDGKSYRIPFDPRPDKPSGAR